MTLQAIFESPDLMILATGIAVGVASALIGPFLILRQSAMTTDAISHTLPFGIVLVWLATGQVSGPLQLLGAGAVGVLTVVATEALAASGRLARDAALGLVFPTLFATGVLLVNLFARNVHIDIDAVLLGEIGFVWLDTVEVAGLPVPDALIWMAAMALVNAMFVMLFWKELTLAIFDPVLAHAFGFRPRLVTLGLLGLTSATAVAAFDAVGVVLFVVFVVVPSAAAYLVTDRLGRMVGVAVAVAVLGTAGGYAAAVALDVSIGGAMALATGLFLVAALVAGPRHGLIARTLRRGRARRDNAARALVIHLMTHEDSETARVENAVGALSDHLGWRGPEAARVVGRALDLGYVTQAGERLQLTDAGRQAADAVLSPWRRGAAARQA